MLIQKNINEKVIWIEQWKDIKGYEGYYEISNHGNVRNKKTGNILKGDKNSIGYRRVTLYQPVKQRVFIHRLVAIHFVPGYDDDLVVNHKDGNKENNHAENLEWVTRSQNDIHAFKLGLRSIHPCTFKHGVALYDPISGELIKTYKTTHDCAMALNVKRPNIYACCNGSQKTCRGYVLKYI